MDLVLMQFKFVLGGQGRELFVRLHLIPECHGGDIVLQGQVTSAGLPAKGLDGDFQILFKTNGILNVPAVQSKTLLRFIMSVRPDDLRHAAVRRGKFRIVTFAVRSGGVKIIGSAEIIFCSCSADRWKFLVAINEEFDYALTPPTAIVHAPREVGPAVLAGA